MYLISLHTKIIFYGNNFPRYGLFFLKNFFNLTSSPFYTSIILFHYGNRSNIYIYTYDRWSNLTTNHFSIFNSWISCRTGVVPVFIEF